MTAPQRVHVTHTFKSNPATVFAALSKHENLGPILGATVTSIGSDARRIKIGPLPAFVETVQKAEEPSLIEYQITEGSPLKDHWGKQTLAPTADGGTEVDWKIGFNGPGAKAVAKILQGKLSKGLPKLVD